MDAWLPYTNCGIATYPNRAIGMTGLSPARLRPCRPLHKTPVVSLSLAIAQPGLLPSAQSNASAFTCTAGLSSLMDHNYTFFGAQYRACTLVPSSFVLPLPGLHVDFSTDLVASLWSGGTLTMCDHPLGNINQFHPDLRGIPRFRVYLGTRIDLLGCKIPFLPHVNK